MHEIPSVPEHLSDPDLIAEVTRLAALERKAIAALVSALAELDARPLYLGQGCSSMFTYCTQVLRLSEHAPSTGSRPRGRRVATVTRAFRHSGAHADVF